MEMEVHALNPKVLKELHGLESKDVSHTIKK
jgi:hypothetical protein